MRAHLHQPTWWHSCHVFVEISAGQFTGCLTSQYKTYYRPVLVRDQAGYMWLLLCTATIWLRCVLYRRTSEYIGLPMLYAAACLTTIVSLAHMDVFVASLKSPSPIGILSPKPHNLILSHVNTGWVVQIVWPNSIWRWLFDAVSTSAACRMSTL